MTSLRDTATWIAERLGETEGIEVITDGSAIPVVSFTLKGDPGFTVYDLSHELRTGGWQVPAYPMPADATDVSVLRIVVREGFSRDLAAGLFEAFTTAYERLQAGARPKSQASGFKH